MKKVGGWKEKEGVVQWSRRCVRDRGGISVSSCTKVLNNNNKKFLYRAIPRKNLQARGAVRYQHQNPLDNKIK